MIAGQILMCLALNAYWEAGNQDPQSMIAVNQVVMNRVASDIYPNDACEVIFQGPTRPSWKNPDIEYPIKNRCQFSWYCDGKSDAVNKDHDAEYRAWMHAVRTSMQVMSKTAEDLVDGAMWYHADYVNPKWSKNLTVTTTIGSHIFYKEPE